MPVGSRLNLSGNVNGSFSTLAERRWAQSSARDRIGAAGRKLSFRVDLGDAALVMEEGAKQHNATLRGRHQHRQVDASDRRPRYRQKEIRNTGFRLPIVQGIKIVVVGVEQGDR